MGKKFKFGGLGDSSPKIETEAPSAPPPPASSAPPAAGRPSFARFKTDLAPDEMAAPVAQPPARRPGAAEEEIFGSPVSAARMDALLNKHFQGSDEGAARFSQSTIDFSADSMPASGDGYLDVLSAQTGLRVVNLGQYPRPPVELLKLLHADQAKRLRALPVALNEHGEVMVAVSDPSNTLVTDDLRAIIGRAMEVVIAKDSEIKERVEQYYGLGDETLDDIVAKVETFEQNDTHAAGGVTTVDLAGGENDSPLIKLVNALLIKAIKSRASDIHIEPFQNVIRIRYRIDGVLREIPSPPFNMLVGLLTRIKVLANMNISESRLPQDGRIKVIHEGREIDLRVSTMPVSCGEAVVMRILDKNMMMIGIGQIGMTEEMLDRFMKQLNKPNGLLLVTGPTGSGKTTTLYAAVSEIKDPGDKLITVEDPVEFELPGIVQVNINEGVGLTFAKCLRAILRQDPDTVLVGEIRDVETAQISIQASLTGHLVFSTLHTNSAAATITRLIDMGVPPFMITSALQAVVGQRLVRMICPTCREPRRPSEEELNEFDLTPDQVRDITFFHGAGCHDCGHSGYRGRIGIYEFLEVDDEIRELVLEQAGTDEIQHVARKKGLKTMREDGWLKVTLGLTTLEEVARETPKDVEYVPYEEGEENAPAKSNGKAAAAPPPPAVPELPPLPEPVAAALRQLPPGGQPVLGPAVASEAATRVLDRILKKPGAV